MEEADVSSQGEKIEKERERKPAPILLYSIHTVYLCTEGFPMTIWSFGYLNDAIIHGDFKLFKENKMYFYLVYLSLLLIMCFFFNSQTIDRETFFFII